MSENNSMTGTMVKINVHFDRIDGLKMDDYDFSCDFYVHSTKKVTVPKDKMVRIDEDNYLAVIDTDITGAGDIMMRATAMIPDGDYPNGLRKEVAGCATGITIKK